ncbi:3-hydroxyacyl-CoA dehydrogenase [Chitinimonas sp. BJYL2]|uniref:3-hydroxyacyl-CoA dehydrogenase n=1 Tax=Chitinimonas sp. BJYL2 TaxID=2976696 RepID=UPI0022B55413|nr:3-hydroxyacyl-CoA dehydrogenase [Chitinimonas sp. BJYL2]
MQIPNSVFLVSGGASGLGAAVARRAVREGGKVVIVDRNREAGEQLVADLGAAARFAAADITDEASCKAAVALAISEFGRLDALVNCAGIVHGEKVLGKDSVHALDTFRKVIEVNLIGSFNLLRLAAATMGQQTPGASGERGVIINTASVAAFDGQMGQCAYTASKAAIAGMTLPAARDLARSAIRVMTIAPGIFKTPMMASLPQEVQDSLAANVPFPSRLGDPDEYASLVMAIVGNPMLNGETIRLDGALRMQPK